MMEICQQNVYNWQNIVLMNDQTTAPFNNMQTLKFKAQPTNAFFSSVNQMFGGSSQLLTTEEQKLGGILESACY